jgi:hypothetical protein
MIGYTNCVTICKLAVTVTDMKRVINEQVADQVRELLVNEPAMDEKTMFSGYRFLAVNCAYSCSSPVNFS